MARETVATGEIEMGKAFDDRKSIKARQFVEAGLFNLTGLDTRGTKLCGSELAVYRALCSAAQKLTYVELETLKAAFDGVSVKGESLKK